MLYLRRTHGYKKTASGYEVRFRVNGRGCREHKRVFPTKAECERFQRYTIAQFETQADVKPLVSKAMVAL